MRRVCRCRCAGSGATVCPGARGVRADRGRHLRDPTPPVSPEIRWCGESLPAFRTGLRTAPDECKFISVNLNSSRRRARRSRPARAARAAPRAELRSQMRRTVRETVRLAILDAAEELIARHGLHNAALVQIAKR